MTRDISKDMPYAMSGRRTREESCTDAALRGVAAGAVLVSKRSDQRIELIMRNVTAKATVVALTCAAVLSLLSFFTEASAEERQTLKVRQDLPVLVTVDIGDPGVSHADMLAFEATITSDDGSSGILRGILITVDIPDDSGDVLEDRVGQLVFDLGDGNMLVVSGASVYPDQSIEMATNKEQIRAVIGGTGRFIGARGQVTTVRADRGHYDHTFELLD
jgi:hypothetical protein